MTATRAPEPDRDSGSQSTGGRRQKARPERDAYLDNAKGLLIVLVVIGHAIEQAHDTMAGNALYLLIYSFHMPAFVLITGYLTRNVKATPRGYLKIVTTLLVPYVVFQVLHRICSTVLAGEPFTLRLLDPEWTLWFLLATAWWRAAAPLLMKLPHRLPIAVAVSLGAGFLPELPSILAVNRTLTLLPFFVLGLSMKPRHLELVKKHSSRVSGLITFVILGALAWGIQGAIPGDTFFYNASFHQLSGVTGESILFRLATLTTGVVGTCAVLAIVPLQKTWWTHLGRFSMYVYMLHAIVLHLLRAFDLVDWPDSAGDISLVAAGAVALSLLLASRPVRKVTKPVVQPPVQKLIEIVEEKAVEPRTTEHPGTPESVSHKPRSHESRSHESRSHESRSHESRSHESGTENRGAGPTDLS